MCPSSMASFKKFFIANIVNQQLNDIRDDFDHCYKSLQLAISIDDVVNREIENDEIKNDLNHLKKFVSMNLFQIYVLIKPDKFTINLQ